jgi:hypothetical protein
MIEIQIRFVDQSKHCQVYRLIGHPAEIKLLVESILEFINVEAAYLTAQ